MIIKIGNRENLEWNAVHFIHSPCENTSSFSTIQSFSRERVCNAAKKNWSAICRILALKASVRFLLSVISSLIRHHIEGTFVDLLKPPSLDYGFHSHENIINMWRYLFYIFRIRGIYMWMHSVQ